MCLVAMFFNNSLRTRLSTQKAALNLGMNPIVLDVNQGAWKLETGRGVVMDGDKSEHILEAIPVMGSMCDMIGSSDLTSRTMGFIPRFRAAFWVLRRVRRLLLKNTRRTVLLWPSAWSAKGFAFT